MSELREKIIDEILNCYPRFVPTERLADAILSFLDSSPKEFEAVRKCGCVNGKIFMTTGNLPTPTNSYLTACIKCGGTGEIVRPLTQKEVMEWAEEVIQFMNKNIGQAVFKNYPTLPSGERVRRKE